jgi:hypothetical protein
MIYILVVLFCIVPAFLDITVQSGGDLSAALLLDEISSLLYLEPLVREPDTYIMNMGTTSPPGEELTPCYLASPENSMFDPSWIYDRVDVTVREFMDLFLKNNIYILDRLKVMGLNVADLRELHSPCFINKAQA